jgi:hypothetical protein
MEDFAFNTMTFAQKILKSYKSVLLTFSFTFCNIAARKLVIAARLWAFYLEKSPDFP